MKKIPQKFVYEKINIHEKFYVYENAAVNLSKIYFLKTQRKHVSQTTAIQITIEKCSEFIEI